MMNWQDLAMVVLLLAAEVLSNVGSFSVETEEQMVRVSWDTGLDGSTVVPHTRPTGGNVATSCGGGLGEEDAKYKRRSGFGCN